VTLSPKDTRSVLEMLVDIRRTQSETIDRMSDDWRHALHFGSRVDKLAGRVSKLRSAVPTEPTNPQVVSLRRDVKEFEADVSALRSRIDDLVAMTSGVTSDMAGIKTTLDIIQSRIEVSDI
jgi:hypothetical protein